MSTYIVKHWNSLFNKLLAQGENTELAFQNTDEVFLKKKKEEMTTNTRSFIRNKLFKRIKKKRFTPWNVIEMVA